MSRWSLEIESGRQPRGRAREVDGDARRRARRGAATSSCPTRVVSRQHCRIERRGEELWIEDLGSRFGTRLNGRAVAGGAARLADRDLLELSDDEPRSSSAAARKHQPPTAAYAARDAVPRRHSMLVQRADLEAATSERELRRYAERLQLLNEVHQALPSPPRATPCSR